jgi:hypothetical protein
MARDGLIVIIAASASNRPPRLGPSSTISTGAPSLTGNLRGLNPLAALIAARGVLGTLLGAVIATTSYDAVVPWVALFSANPGNLA